MFGGDWTGKEPGMDTVGQLPAQQDAESQDKDRAYKILRKHNDDYIAKRKAAEAEWEIQRERLTLKDRVRWLPFTKDEWLAAQGHVDAEIEAQRPGLLRRDAVDLEIVRRCRVR